MTIRSIVQKMAQENHNKYSNAVGRGVHYEDYVAAYIAGYKAAQEDFIQRLNNAVAEAKI
jgi:hypothetical protein